MSMIALLLLFILIPLLTVGIILLIRGWRGTPTFSQPRCAKCGYDVRGVDIESANCPECGADLKAKHAVRFGEYKRRPGLIVAGAAMVAIPVLLVGFMIFGLAFWFRGGPPGRSQPTATLITNLATRADQPWDWQELERRLSAGNLSQADVTAAIDKLIAHLQKSRPNNTGPLVWSDDFFKAAMSRGMIPPEQFDRLAKAFYGQSPTVTVHRRVRVGEPIRFDIDYGGPWDLPGVKLVKALRQVKVGDDGPDLTLTRDGQRDSDTPSDPDWFSASDSSDIRGSSKIGLEPGEYELTFVIDAGILPETGPINTDLGRPGQQKRWPKTLSSWTLKVTKPLTVVPADEPAVVLIDDASRDPFASGAITVESIIVRQDGDRRYMKVTFARTQTPGAVAVCATVSVRIGEKAYAAGTVTFPPGGGGTTSITTPVQDLPDDAQSADLTLTPSIERAEADPQIESLYNRPIELKDVPVLRRDRD